MKLFIAFLLFTSIVSSSAFAKLKVDAESIAPILRELNLSPESIRKNGFHGRGHYFPYNR